jgi:ArsR family metal-binding transcriptional regulator
MKKPRKKRRSVKADYVKWMISIHPDLFRALKTIKAEKKARKQLGATISDLINEALVYWVKLVIKESKKG